MPSGKLFQAVTGFPPQQASDALAADAAAAPAAPRTDSRREDDFEAILMGLAARADADPDGVARQLSDALGFPVESDAVQDLISQSMELAKTGTASDMVEEDYDGELVDAELLGAFDAVTPAENFSERYRQAHIEPRYWQSQSDISIKPYVSRFEDDSALGRLGWLVFNGPEAVAVPRSLKWPFRERFGDIFGAKRFLRHEDFLSNFDYGHEAPSGGEPLRVALFADFGTGLAHSRYIARQISVDRYPLAFHLGDVYYTGTGEQYREYFADPLAPALENGTELFVLPDNHDGYSGFHAYTDFLNRGGAQQEGSYFTVETEHVQFIGVDTIWHSERGRIRDKHVRSWLKARLAEGRQAKRANVLLTGHHPYEYGSTSFEVLHEDVSSFSNGDIDLWFWGNTHYCALFGPGGDAPYVGSCIGHGGYPYKKLEKGGRTPNGVKTLFVETGSRYEPEPIRADRGMNGFCSLEIQANGDVHLRYLDWRGKERCVAELSRQANGALRLEPGHVTDLTATT